jgi:hypothetical protein
MPRYLGGFSGWFPSLPGKNTGSRFVPVITTAAPWIVTIMTEKYDIGNDAAPS